MSFDIEKSVEAGKLTPLADEARDADDIEAIFESDRDILDVEKARVYMPDFGGDNGTELFGIMFADVDFSDMEEVDDPGMWAREMVPAPGTGAENRMEYLELGEASLLVSWALTRGDCYIINSED